ncbi:MAG: SRPBCC family protein [Solirubrobacteraceae bacterium]
MAVAHKSATLPASQQQLWELIADPHHIPRWWPGVERVEGVKEDRFTQVLKTKRGRPVRADFRIVESQPPWAQAWSQEIAGTPFARVLSASVIEIHLEPVGDGTRVTITQQQKLRGYSRTGGLMLRRATAAKLSEALDGLARISG